MLATTTTTTSAVSAKAATTAVQPPHNHYHDSTGPQNPVVNSSLVVEKGQDATPSSKDGQSVIRAAKAAYEQKLRANKLHLTYSPEPSGKKRVEENGLSEKNGEVTSDVGRTEGEEEFKGASGGNGSLGDGPEVFLGGSCNPTTWRADVAIPTLNKLGISFYNPQVSDWTPDLIELEHRAKEKARVLFFVMDSETRATAGAIEAAHIAGLNTKQLVLVLHPYQPNQKILNETVSKQ